MRVRQPCMCSWVLIPPSDGVVLQKQRRSALRAVSSCRNRFVRRDVRGREATNWKEEKTRELHIRMGDREAASSPLSCIGSVAFVSVLSSIAVPASSLLADVAPGPRALSQGGGEGKRNEQARPMILVPYRVVIGFFPAQPAQGPTGVDGWMNEWMDGKNARFCTERIL